MVWYPVPLTKTLTEKRELNAPKSHANKKNRARQKIARARTTLKYRPHKYARGSTFVFLLLAVYCFKE